MIFLGILMVIGFGCLCFAMGNREAEIKVLDGKVTRVETELLTKIEKLKGLADIPKAILHFSDEAQCAQCAQPLGEDSTEVFAIAEFEQNQTPVTLRICQDCVDNA